MLASPDNWAKYYHGSTAELALQRHFSYSDRMRYYWPQPEADAAVARLFEVLGDKELPETLIGQYLGARYESVRNGRLAPYRAQPRHGGGGKPHGGLHLGLRGLCRTSRG